MLTDTTPKAQNPQAAVVIIGAGPAGLTAAFELLRGGQKRVIVLEASDAIGGISRTIRHNGNHMDLGGHRFYSKDDRVMAWWVDRMPVQGQPARDDRRTGRPVPLTPGGPDPEQTDRVMLVRRRISRIYALKRLFDYPISLKASTLRNLGLWRTFCAGCSYLVSAVRKHPEHSLEDFYINRFGRVLYGLFFERYTEKVWGRHPSAISADWGAQRVKGLSIRAVLKDMLQKLFRTKRPAAAPDPSQTTETSLIESFYYPKYGPGQLWEEVSRDIVAMGGEIRLGCRVTGLVADESDPGRIRAVAWAAGPDRQPDGSPDAGVVEADYVLSSMPLRDLVDGLQGLDVPEEIRAIARNLPYRDFMTVGLLVDRLSITNQTTLRTVGDIVPDCWIYIQEPGVQIGRLQIFNNWSPYLVADPEHTVWLGLEYFCQEGDALWQTDDAAFIRMATAELEQIGLIRADDVRDACRIRVAKAYPAYFDSYDQIDRLVQFLDRLDNLSCIGRNGQHRYNNMDHSMLTGMMAAEQILTGQIDRPALWRINTEQSYQEVKKHNPSGRPG
jgi:protoporphyrinogen oxidase